MSRYIDADALLEYYNAMSNIEWNKNVAPYSWAYAYEAIIDHIEELPAADVVPREEADKWFKECEELQGRMIDLEKEIAKEIFAELSKVGVNEFRYPVISEIKNKYTEDKSEKDCLCPRCREKKNNE